MIRFLLHGSSVKMFELRRIRLMYLSRIFLFAFIFTISSCFFTNFFIYAQAAPNNNSNNYQSFSKRNNSYDWLQFNFNSQHSGNNTKEATINRKNVNKLKMLYQVSLPSVADGAPVYLSNVKTKSGNENIIFVTTKDGHIIAINAKSGKTIWSHQYGTGIYRINNGSQATYTTSSPAIDPDKNFVYSYGLDGFVHKYKVGDGKEIKGEGWPELCTLKPFNEKGSSALSIATAKNGNSYLYVANGGYLGDRGDYQGHVTIINLKNGRQRVFNANCSNNPVHFKQKPAKPDCPAVQTAVWARAGVVYNSSTNKIYFATGNGPFNPKKHNWGDAVLALNPNGTGKNGNPIDSYTPRNFDELDRYDLDLGSTAPAIIPTPKNCKIKNLAIQSGKDKIIRLINLSNLNGHGIPGYTGGEAGKSVKIPSAEMVFTQPAVWVNPADNASWVFVGTYHGLAAFRLYVNKPGFPYLKLMWKKSEGSSSPIIANNILFCAVNGSIRALNPVTGDLLWRNENIADIHWESPIVDNGVLFITDESGNLTAFGIQNRN